MSDKQAGADLAAELWPRLVEQERQRVTKLEDDDDMVTMLQAARRIGAVTVEAFEVEASTSERLTAINWHLRDMGALFGPLQPLAEAVSAELYRRRVVSPLGSPPPLATCRV